MHTNSPSTISAAAIGRLSAAEHLPEDDLLLPNGSFTEYNLDVDAESRVQSPDTREPERNFNVLHSWDPQGTLAEYHAQLGADNSNLPVRKLQHGKLMDLWWQYLAWLPMQSDTEPASWSTFWRTWNRKWDHCLKFRQRNQHKECTTCSQYSHHLHYGTHTVASKKLTAKRWRIHLQQQYADRYVYYALRMASRSHHSRVLTIIIDSMDKAKCAWPQYSFRKIQAVNPFHLTFLFLLTFDSNCCNCLAISM